MDSLPVTKPSTSPLKPEDLPTVIPPGSATFALSSGSYDTQGPVRLTMEDAHVHIDDFRPQANSTRYSRLAFYAVYDGHGGDQIAKMVAQDLHSAVAASKKFSEGDIKGALTEGFATVDKAVVELCNNHGWMVGTTAVVGMVVDDQLIVANVGDSEAIAVSVENNKPIGIELTTPHKATDAAEKARIEALGGHVFLGRVFGSLAVTRAFGDSKYKTPKMSQDFVSVEPAFHELKLTPDHKYLLFACDGLWDVMNHQEAAVYIYEKTNQNISLNQICADIIAEAIKRGSTDNVTAILVKLDWSGAVSQDWNLEDAWNSVPKSFEDFSRAYDDVRIADTVSKSIQNLSDAYEEINIVESVTTFYQDIRISESISATAAELGKAYDELDVSKSLGELYQGFTSAFPSIFGRDQNENAPSGDGDKPSESTPGEVRL